MVYAHPAEIEACRERAERAEAEAQRLREIISEQADTIATLDRALARWEGHECSA